MKANMKRGQKLTKQTNPTLWNEMTRKGAPKPSGDSVLWNDWAGNNPQPEAKALKALDPSDALMLGIKGITTGARPVDCE